MSRSWFVLKAGFYRTDEPEIDKFNSPSLVPKHVFDDDVQRLRHIETRWETLVSVLTFSGNQTYGAEIMLN
jgi:hypothetical protein